MKMSISMKKCSKSNQISKNDFENVKKCVFYDETKRWHKLFFNV